MLLVYLLLWKQFWAVMPYGTTDWSKINVDTANSTTDTNPVSSFWSMQKALNEHYDNVSAPNNTILVRMGEVVAARSMSGLVTDDTGLCLGPLMGFLS